MFGLGVPLCRKYGTCSIHLDACSMAYCMLQGPQVHIGSGLCRTCFTLGQRPLLAKPARALKAALYSSQVSSAREQTREA